MTFDVDVNGILSVTAKELVSGQRSMIKIEDSDRLDRESIDRAVRDAERFREEDEKAASRVASRNALESYIYGVKAALKQKELRSRMDDDVSSALSIVLCMLLSLTGETAPAADRIIHCCACTPLQDVGGGRDDGEVGLPKGSVKPSSRSPACFATTAPSGGRGSRTGC